MKALLLVIVATLIGYTAWAVAAPRERRTAARFVIHHGVRLGGLLLLILALLAAAFYLPATGLF